MKGLVVYQPVLALANASSIHKPTHPTHLTMASPLDRIKPPRNTGRFGLIGILAVVLLIMVPACMTKSIGSGEAGVKYSSFSGTNMNTVYGEGLNVFLPWERMVVYDVRENAQNETLSALSSNGATINMDVTVRYSPTMENLPYLHTTFGREYYERLIQPELRSAAREVVGRYTPEELYSTRRNELQALIFQHVASAAAEQYVDVAAVLIRDVVLPDQVRRAIENKLEEEQLVEQAALSVRRAEQEAARKRVEAQGDADRARIVTQSLTPQFLRWQGIEATRELAQSDNAKVVIIGGSGDGLPIILGE